MAGEWTLPGLGNDLLTSEKFGVRRLKTESSLIINNGTAASVQNPLPTDGDSVYAKDIWISESDITGWSGSVTEKSQKQAIAIALSKVGKSKKKKKKGK